MDVLQVAPAEPKENAVHLARHMSGTILTEKQKIAILRLEPTTYCL